MLKKATRTILWRPFRNTSRRKNRRRYTQPAEHLESRILLTGSLNLPHGNELPAVDSGPVDRSTDQTGQGAKPASGPDNPGPDNPGPDPGLECSRKTCAEETVSDKDPAVVFGIQNTYTLAQMARSAYIGASGVTRTLEQISSSLPARLSAAGWSALRVTSNTRTGFHAVLFKNSHSGQQVLAFAGTQTVSAQDWVNNTRQSMGLTATQYSQAVEMARSLKNGVQGNAVQGNAVQEVAFTGHSL
ncbi:MAG: hypothetical protein VB858_05350, partial [Planctomycetaceae bacterium]